MSDERGTGARVHASDIELMTLLNVLYGVLMLSRRRNFGRVHHGREWWNESLRNVRHSQSTSTLTSADRIYYQISMWALRSTGRDSHSQRAFYGES
jgi:hypothetical protein